MHPAKTKEKKDDVPSFIEKVAKLTSCDKHIILSNYDFLVKASGATNEVIFTLNFISPYVKPVVFNDSG